MYSRCLFCHSDLGRNTLVEAFPVGRRLAYDASRGRLWVVCRKCERWNLTPLEERWEAMEVAERMYRDTRARVATEQVGLARFTDDHGRFELVRIGKPLRPEFAAWRYGDQFGRRRRRYVALTAGAVAVGGAVVVAGPITGLVGAGLASPFFNLVNVVGRAYAARAVMRVPLDDGRSSLTVRRRDVGIARLTTVDGRWSLTLKGVRDRQDSTRWWSSMRTSQELTLTGDAAVRVAGTMLPAVNRSGGSSQQVQDAVRMLERHESPEHLFATIASGSQERWNQDFWNVYDVGALKNIPVVMRLALEMAAHDETERRAMEGELALLEAAWRDAEEIARIADSL